MGFDSGSISFRRFAVVGSQPSSIDQALLDQLAEHALQPSEIGRPLELEYGFNGGRHVLDDQFTFDNNVFGDALHFALRIDTNKVPSELTKAYALQEEVAAAKDNPSGFISKKQRQSARETAQQRIDDDLRSGKYRRSKLLPILWDLPASTIYCNASTKAEEKLLEIFDRVFSLTLEPLSSGSMALRKMEDHAHRRDYEDARPTRFVNGPSGESQRPEYPWVAKGPQAKDFFGNEFVLWLWHECEQHGGAVRSGDVDVAIVFEKSLDLDCAFGETGQDSLRSAGPTQMPEARDALRSGKVPRRAGLIFDAFGRQYTFSLAAESMAVRSLRLPKVEEAADARAVFDERIGMVREFAGALDGLFAAFLQQRAGSGWENQTSTLRKWIMRSARPAAVAVA